MTPTHNNKPMDNRQRIQEMAHRAIDNHTPYAWFESLYQQANQQEDQIPWAKLKPHPLLASWLQKNPRVGASQTALVVGCGLGDDAEALANQGFTVTAFDVSETAIAWCKQRFPQSQVTYQVADVFAPPENWHQGFDMVFECYTIQALPLKVRSQTIEAIASLVTPGGKLLIITRLRATETEPDGPPWPLSWSELSHFQAIGFQEVQRDTLEQQPNTLLAIEYNALHSNEVQQKDPPFLRGE